MATRLVYNGIEFTDATIMSGQMIREKSPLTDTLTYDTLEVRVFDQGGLEDWLLDANQVDLQDVNGQQLIITQQKTMKK